MNAKEDHTTHPIGYFGYKKAFKYGLYEIQRVKDIRRAASMKAGGVGMRYTCVVDGSYLFYEDNISGL